MKVTTAGQVKETLRQGKYLIESMQMPYTLWCFCGKADMWKAHGKTTIGWNRDGSGRKIQLKDLGTYASESLKTLLKSENKKPL